MSQAQPTCGVLWLRRNLPLHARAYALGAALLVAANLATSANWWSFWPVLGWAGVVFVHYLVVKSFSIDDAWAARRALDVTEKAYDAGHIETIRDAYEHPTAPGRRTPDAPPDA